MAWSGSAVVSSVGAARFLHHTPLFTKQMPKMHLKISVEVHMMNRGIIGKLVV